MIILNLTYARAILLPILLAYASLYVYRTFLSTSTPPTPSHTSELDVPIPVPKILNSALRKFDISSTHAATPTEICLMYECLMQLQNPELTPYAGPGYGFDLRVVNPGARIDAFPNGRLPRADGRGRYDAWERVKGLRWGVAYINADPWWGGLLKGPGSVQIGGNERAGRGREGVGVEVSAIDEAGIAGAALLLEAAGAEDLAFPMPPGSGRSAFGEAVDRLVKRLFDGGDAQRVFVGRAFDGTYTGNLGLKEDADTDTGKVFVKTGLEADGVDGGIDGGSTRDSDATAARAVGEPTDVVVEQDPKDELKRMKQRWVLGRRCKHGDAPRDYEEDDCGVLPEDMFTIPSLLAEYAVARQNITWLIEAVELFKAYHNPSIWLHEHDLGENERVGIFEGRQQPGQGTSHEEVQRQNMKSAAYALMSATRLRFIIERWQPREAALRTGFDSTAKYSIWRENSLRILAKICEVVWLSQQDYLRARLKSMDTAENTSTNAAESKATNATNERWADELPFVAMLVSSHYSICTLSKQQAANLTALLYASIAREIGLKSGADISLESQIGILLMYSARRDNLADGQSSARQSRL